MLLSPLPLGSSYPWSGFLLPTCVGALLVLWSSALLLARRAPPVPISFVRVPLLLFGGVCVWILVQWLPQTPAAWHHPIWADAGRALGRDLPGRISVNPEQTITALLRLGAYGGVFWLSLQLGRSRDRARRGLQLFVGAGVGYALYGLLAYFSGGDQILWLRERHDTSHVTSTFVNRNSYATFAGLVLVSASAIALDRLGGALGGEAPARVKARSALNGVLGPGAPLQVALLVVGTALLLTASRAGTLSALFGLLVLVLALLRSRALPGRRVAAISGGLLLMGVAVFSLSGEPLRARLQESEPQAGGRAAVYARIVHAIGDTPLLGTGYGSFPDVFPLYRDETIRGIKTWRRAHNSYLENTLELGIPAAAALFAAIASCARICWVGLQRRRRDRVYPAVGVAATALVATHAGVDFSLQIPAVSVSYAFLLGLACAQSFATRRP